MELTKREQRATKTNAIESVLVDANQFSANQRPTVPSTDLGSYWRQLTSWLEIPFVHKRTIVVCVLVAIFAAWLAILFLPRHYRSEAKMKVRVGRESVSLDPTITTNSILMLQRTQEEEIVSALEILSSRDVAEDVVDRITPDAILEGKLPELNIADSGSSSPVIRAWASTARDYLYGWLLTAGIKDSISNRELAVMKVQSSVGIETPRKSTIINIDATAETPEMAQAIASEMVEAFLARYIEATHTQGSFSFFSEQSSETEQQLRDMIAARSEFMQSNEIVSIEASRNLLQLRMEGIDRDLIIAQGEAEQATSQIRDLQAKLDRAEDEIVASKNSGADSTWSGMRQQVYELEVAEQKAAATFVGRHPELKLIRKQLDGAREILARIESERVDENRTPNPVRLDLVQQMQQQQTRAVGLHAMIAEKQKQRDQMRGEIDKMLSREERLLEMDRNIQLAESSLQTLRLKLEESRVIEELNSRHISNLHIFQPATFVERAVSPKKPLLALGFLCLGLMAGFGLSVLREVQSPNLRTPADVSSRLGVPLLASVPKLKERQLTDLQQSPNQKRLFQSLVSDVLISTETAGRSEGRSLGIIGVDSGAGASTVAVNLALASSIDFNLKTMLVDADTQTREVSRRFGLNGSPGLVELCEGTASHDECVQRVADFPVDIIASASDSCRDPLTGRAEEIVQSLAAYQHQCDLMILDLPSASHPGRAIALAQHLDCVIVVVESEKTMTADAERLLERLILSETQVVGVVLNKTKQYAPSFARRLIASQA